MRREVPVRRSVVVIGGGNAAVDSARSARRLGADVTIVYRRERKDMPAIAEEVEAAEHEGARIAYLATPNRIIGDAEGKVRAIEVERTRPGEFDESGRRRPVPTGEIIAHRVRHRDPGRGRAGRPRLRQRLGPAPER